MVKPLLTKTCSNCGLAKPLSAFLQMSGIQGTVAYGNICSSCRKTAMEKKSILKDREGSTTSTTGRRIGSTEKKHGDLGRQKEKEAVQHLYHEERDEKQKDETKLDEKKLINVKDETKRKTREAEKRFFSSTPTTKTDAKQAAATHQQKEHQVRTGLQETKERTDSAQKEERRKTEIDFNAPYLPSAMGAEVRRQSTVFLGMQTWLRGSPMAQQINKAAAAVDPTGKVAEKSEQEIVETVLNPTSGRKR